MKPTYIGIGAQKCASSWLHEMLAEHPDVCVGAEKEIDFFSYHFDHGYQWYERQFETCDAAQVVGEISPSYFCGPVVPQRVQSYSPEIKIILSLRNPVQRALSNHRHEVRVGHVNGPDLSFEAGLANNPMYVEQGLYATHLKRWLQYFPREQILIVLMDDVESVPLDVARKVYQFVGADPDYRPANIAMHFNRSYANRSRLLRTVKDSVYKLSRMPWLSWLWTFATKLGLRKMYRGINQVASQEVIPAPGQEVLTYLDKIFAPEIVELEQLLGRSLEAWRT